MQNDYLELFNILGHCFYGTSLRLFKLMILPRMGALLHQYCGLGTFTRTKAIKKQKKRQKKYWKDVSKTVKAKRGQLLWKKLLISTEIRHLIVDEGIAPLGRISENANILDVIRAS